MDESGEAFDWLFRKFGPSVLSWPLTSLRECEEERSFFDLFWKIGLTQGFASRLVLNFSDFCHFRLLVFRFNCFQILWFRIFTISFLIRMVLYFQLGILLVGPTTEAASPELVSSGVCIELSTFAASLTSLCFP